MSWRTSAIPAHPRPAGPGGSRRAGSPRSPAPRASAAAPRHGPRSRERRASTPRSTRWAQTAPRALQGQLAVVHGISYCIRVTGNGEALLGERCRFQRALELRELAQRIRPQRARVELERDVQVDGWRGLGAGLPRGLQLQAARARRESAASISACDLTPVPASCAVAVAAAGGCRRRPSDRPAASRGPWIQGSVSRPRALLAVL